MHVPDWMITGAGKLGLKWLEAWLSRPKRQEEEIQRLRRELEAVTAKAAEYESFDNLKDQFTHSQEDGVFWHKDGSGPYCSVCMDVDHRPVHLVPVGNGYYACGEHKNLTYDLGKLHQMPRPHYPKRRSRNRLGRILY